MLSVNRNLIARHSRRCSHCYMSLRRFVRNRKYSVNDNFFRDGIISDEHAWVWGWFITDGGASLKNGIRWKLRYDSFPALQSIRHVLCATNPVTFGQIQPLENNPICYFQITSKALYSDIALLLGRNPNHKCFHLQLPIVDPLFLPALLRGIVDGDGCWALVDGRFHFHISSSSIIFLQQVQNAVNEHCLKTTQPAGTISKPLGGHLCRCLLYSKTDHLNAIGSWLYPIEHTATHLFTEHKYNRFKLHQSLFVNDGILKPQIRKNLMKEFRTEEVQRKNDCLDKLILMSKGEIECPTYFSFSPSWYKRYPR